MQTYITSKLFSLAFPIVLIVLAVLFAKETMTSWVTVYTAVIIIGYTHVLLGLYYHFTSLLKKKEHTKIVFLFSIFILSLAIVLYLQDVGYAMLVVLLLIPTFTFHGVLNEQTLIGREANTSVPWVYFVAPGLWFVAFIYMSIPHPSFFMANTLIPNILDLSPLLLSTLYQSFPEWLFVSLPIMVIALASLYLLYATIRDKYYSIGLFTLPIMIILPLYTYFINPIPYVYVVGVLLMYHFILWMVHYTVSFYKNQRTRLRQYTLLHAIIIIPLVLIALFGDFFPKAVYTTFLSMNTFIAFSYAHIAVSFLNEGNNRMTWPEVINSFSPDKFEQHLQTPVKIPNKNIF